MVWSYSRVHLLLQYAKIPVLSSPEILLTIKWALLKSVEWLFSQVRAVALSNYVDSLRRWANARNVSFRISLRWPIDIINPVD